MRQVLEILPVFVRDDLARLADGMRQRDRHRPRSGSRLDHALTRTDAHRHEDEADVLGIQDLRVARQFVEQVRQRWLEQEERRPDVAEDLRAPGQTDQVIVFEHAAMRLQFPVRGKGEDEVFMPQTDQLCDLTCRCVRGGWVPGHEFILPCSRWLAVR